MPNKSQLLAAGVVAGLVFVLGAMWMQHDSTPTAIDKYLSDDVRTMLETGDQFTLLTLDPVPISRREPLGPEVKDSFHGYEVLGRMKVSDQADRDALIRALYQGISDFYQDPGAVAACFDPRHGITVASANKKLDLVICFECAHMHIYAGLDDVVHTTSYPKRTFNSVASRAGLKIASE